MASAAESANPSIPIIDIGPLLAADSSPTVKQATAQTIFDAFRVHGFLYVQNHGIPASQIETAFSQSAHFFATVTPDDKQRLAWTTPAANRGFSRMGLERVSELEDEDRVAALRAAAPDLKESFEIGREGEPQHPNHWPAGQPEFKAAMLAFHAACAALHRALLSAIAQALGLPPGWFDAYVRRADNTLRLLHYPSVPARVFAARAADPAAPPQVRAGAHTDFGSLTLLFQDAAGGLQVQGPDRRSWLDATPVPGTVVVNAGDLLARWTNDVIRSTLHRVVEPPRKAVSAATTAVDGQSGGRADGEAVYPARYSIAYFCNPDFDREIDVVPGTLGAGEAKKYEAVNSGEYLVRRLTATY